MSRVCWKCHGPKAPTIPHSDSDCIEVLRGRIEAIESKLGAADVGLSADREAAVKRPITTSSPPAVPKLSADEWRETAKVHRKLGWPDGASACDLAAAVTEWAQLPSSGSTERDDEQVRSIALAFVRGELLPGKTND